MDLIITILPVVTKGLPISPRFSPYDFLSRCKFSTLTTRQPMVEFYLLTFPRFPLRKKEDKSYFGKNRTRDFRTAHVQRECLAEPSLRRILCDQGIFHLSAVLAYDALSRCKFITPTINSTALYSSSSINRLYAQNPVFEIVRDESVKVYLHLYNGNVQQNPLCVESCVTKEFFHLSPVFANDI